MIEYMSYLDLLITDRSAPDNVAATNELRDALHSVPPSRNLEGKRDLHSAKIAS